MLKKLVTFGIVLIFVGSIGCMVTYKGYSEQYESNDVYSEEFVSSSVNNIVLDSSDWTNVEVEVVSTASDKIQVGAKYANSMLDIKATQNNGTVNVGIESKTSNNMGFFFKNDNNKMVVGIPENYTGDITVSGGLTVAIDGVNINSVYFTGRHTPVVSIKNCNIKNEVKSTSNVNLTMSNSTMQTIDVVGWGRFNDIIVDNLLIDSDGNGYIELNNIKVKNDIYVDGGEVRISGITGNEMKLYSEYGRKQIEDAKINNDIVIKNGNGEIELSDINARNIDIDNKNGRVNITDLTTGQLMIDARNGEVNVQQLETVTSEIRSEYGNLQVDELTGNLKITSKNGDVVVDRGQGDIEIYNKYGTVEIDRTEINNNITIDNKNGNVNIYTNINKASDVGFDINVSNGSIEDEDIVNGLSKTGNYKVEVNVGYGSFNID